MNTAVSTTTPAYANMVNLWLMMPEHVDLNLKQAKTDAYRKMIQRMMMSILVSTRGNYYDSPEGYTLQPI